MDTQDQPTNPAIDRITACLTVADDLTAPLDQRAAALTTARQLMAVHRVASAEADAARGTGVDRLTIVYHPVINTDGHGKARASVVIAIAKALDCEGIHQPAAAPAAYSAALIGRTDDVTTARQFARRILPALHDLAKAANPNPDADTGFFPGFIVAYGREVADHLERRRFTLDPGRNRRRADHLARVAAILTERFPDRQAVTFEARADGVIAGRDAARHAGADITHPS